MTNTLADAINVYRCTPRQLRANVLDCFYAGLVPFVQSSPGMGKSAIMRSIAKELRLWLIDHRASTSAPEDFSGLPKFDENGLARFAPFADLFPLFNSEIPEGFDGWMLFLDEFNSAPTDVQAAAYKLVLDRMTGQFPLHDNVVMAMAGNLATDRAIVNRLSTAMQSRVIHLELEISFDEWLEDVALKEGYDSRIIAFLNWKQSYLMDFRPDHDEKTFCCPRTWEFLNRLIKDKEVTDEKTPLYAGTLTSGKAVEFVQFTKVYLNMVKIRDILADPSGCMVPNDASTRWAVVSMMMEKVDEKNFGDLCTYINKYDLTFKVLFFRGVMAQHPELRRHPEFAKAMIEVDKYLNTPSKLAA